MTFHTSSFFIGVGTVLATMVVGFGGGVMMTNALVGKNEAREPNKIEQRTADAKPGAVPEVTNAFATASAPASAEEKKASAPVVEGSQVQTNPAPKPVEKPASVFVPQPVVQPAITPPSTAQLAPELNGEKAARRKALADQKGTERKKYRERRKQELKKDEELDRVAEKVRQVDYDDDDREPVRARSYAAESPFSFMD
jgi:hypothetical protein